MRPRRFTRKTPLVCMLLLLALGLLLFGTYPDGEKTASADIPFPGTEFHFMFLIASDFSPADEATEVPLDAAVSVNFNKDLDPPTIINASNFKIRHSRSLSYLSATRSYNPATYVATLTPNAALQANSTYYVTITEDIETPGGLNLSNPQTWSFHTISSPEVVARTPDTGATGVPIGQTISAEFDKPMNTSSFSSSSFYLQDSDGAKVNAAIDHNTSKTSIYLNPSADLLEGETYVVTITTAVKAQNGLSLETTAVWSFTTAAGAPQVTAQVPTDGASGVPVNQVVSATFNKDMNPATITSATFYIQKSGGSPLAALVAYSAGTRTATLDPAADLEPGTTYEARLTTTIQAANGAPLAATVVWTFTTAPADDGGDDGDDGDEDVTFSDVTGSAYAAAIYALAGRGAVTGYEDGTYRPNELVKRQQFAKMIVLTLGLAVTGSEVCPFTDVAAQTGTDPFYPSKYVAVCAAQGITVGRTPTSFAPYDNITHQQLITMVVRAAGLAAPPVGYLAPFTSSQFSTDEHFQNALKAGAAGLLDSLVGVGPAYNFLAGSTRGECAQILYNLIELMEL